MSDGVARQMGKVADVLGAWRIIEADLWDLEDLDLLTPATISLDRNHDGHLALIAVDAEIDYRVVQRDGVAAIEFSFDGFDEDQRVTGRGWAVLDGDRLRGRLFFHQGDESSFAAERKRQRRPRTTPAERRRAPVPR